MTTIAPWVFWRDSTMSEGERDDQAAAATEPEVCTGDSTNIDILGASARTHKPHVRGTCVHVHAWTACDIQGRLQRTQYVTDHTTSTERYRKGRRKRGAFPLARLSSTSAREAKEALLGRPWVRRTATLQRA